MRAGGPGYLEEVRAGGGVQEHKLQVRRLHFLHLGGAPGQNQRWRGERGVSLESCLGPDPQKRPAAGYPPLPSLSPLDPLFSLPAVPTAQLLLSTPARAPAPSPGAPRLAQPCTGSFSPSPVSSSSPASPAGTPRHLGPPSGLLAPPRARPLSARVHAP